MSRLRLIVAACALVLPTTLLAQVPAPGTPGQAVPVLHPEEGRPFVRGYRPFEAGGGGQIWSIVQDRRGLLYFAANGGVLEFDGARWRRIDVGSSGSVRLMDLAADGRIYVGATQDLGYLAPDDAGEMRFVSLKDRLPADAPPFNDVWRTFVTPGRGAVPDRTGHLPPVGRCLHDDPPRLVLLPLVLGAWQPIDTDLLFREVDSLIEQRKSHKRVLVVDEDASTLKTLTDVLTARGYSVQEARSEDLIERAVALQPDIIMLNSVYSSRAGAVQMLRFERGLENVLFLVYQ